MTEFEICTRCVMDTSDAEIGFDCSGVCSHCRAAEHALGKLAQSEAERSDRLMNRVAAIRRRNRRKEYDAVIGVSGGVDSSWAMVAARNAGLRLLAVHCDTGWNSEEAVNNVQVLCDHLGVDLITHVIDWEAIRDLQTAFFRASVPNCDIPQDHAIMAVNNRVAASQGLKDFVSGGNLVGESILPTSWGHNPKDLSHIRSIGKSFGRGVGSGFPTMSAFSTYVWMPYVRGVRSYRILDDTNYNPLRARAELQKRFGWKDYGGKHHESLFTRFFQAYYLPVKFGYDKRKAHYSSLIVAGLMTRETALELLEQPLYDSQALRRDRKFFLKKLCISESEWADIMAAPPRKHQDYHTHDQWIGWLQSLKRTIEDLGFELRRAT